MRPMGLLVIVLVKATILIIYRDLQNTLLEDMDGEYRFLLYLIACGSSLFALGLTWRKANITELDWWLRWLIFPLIILTPIAVVALYNSPTSVESLIQPFQDVDRLIAFFISELFVIIVVFALLKLALRRRIQVP